MRTLYCLESRVSRRPVHVLLPTRRADVATLLHSGACRLAMILGAHTEPAIARQPTNSEDEWHRKGSLRRLFWQCYACDKHISARSGHAPVMDDEYCDLTLRDIVEFDDALEEWRFSLPPRQLPSPSPTHRVCPEAGVGKPKQVHIILIHLEY
ncbi:hypothetical protein B0I35DRAFT_109727 [Stachybotrys elegans]|uniref:Xylanolytic transcriptional activator regulatory domain-containing protein n=1 Tax=Stachybotrys elegans TaxID=80388 RepID=A0A8K0WL81_9HYPO|nr:hypothetical protein B0I35DRAFT_109727 [Stachybotrys elegans]